MIPVHWWHGAIAGSDGVLAADAAIYEGGCQLPTAQVGERSQCCGLYHFWMPQTGEAFDGSISCWPVFHHHDSPDGPLDSDAPSQSRVGASDRPDAVRCVLNQGSRMMIYSATEA